MAAPKKTQNCRKAEKEMKEDNALWKKIEEIHKSDENLLGRLKKLLRKPAQKKRVSRRRNNP